MIRNKRKALAVASETVSLHRMGDGQYLLIGPNDRTNHCGPTTQCSANNYGRAQKLRARWVAEVALGLLGIDSDAACEAIEYADWNDPYFRCTARALLEIGIDAHQNEGAKQ